MTTVITRRKFFQRTARFLAGLALTPAIEPVIKRFWPAGHEKAYTFFPGYQSLEDLPFAPLPIPPLASLNTSLQWRMTVICGRTKTITLESETRPYDAMGRS